MLVGRFQKYLDMWFILMNNVILICADFFEVSYWKET
jgi:hypothetical protein